MVVCFLSFCPSEDLLRSLRSLRLLLIQPHRARMQPARGPVPVGVDAAEASTLSAEEKDEVMRLMKSLGA